MIKPQISDKFLAMPSEQEMLDNIQMVWDKYKIPKTICETDECHFLFLESWKTQVFNFVTLSQSF